MGIHLFLFLFLYFILFFDTVFIEGVKLWLMEAACLG